MEETPATKKNADPRVEIDTSPPFESVKEAVDRFGGSGPWIPSHLLRLAAAHNNEEFDTEKIEEQAVQLERDLLMKEQQTLNVLKELEATKKFVEGLKLNLIPELCSFMKSPDLNSESHGNPTDSLCFSPMVSPGLMFSELNRAKQNLSKTSVDLAAIQASVESLNKNLRKDKLLLDRRKKMQHMQLQNGEGAMEEGHFEVEQFKKMKEASRYEVMKAMAEIERTKNCIRMAEMRLNAAKKMEEAAKAVEAIALAEKKTAFLNGDSSESNGITLSFQEYQALSKKAKQAEELCNTKFIDTNGLQRTREASQHHDHLEVPILEKFEETTTQNKVSFNDERPHHTNIVIEDSFLSTRTEQGRNMSKIRFKNSHAGNRTDVPDKLTNERHSPGFGSTTSIGDVLSRKVIVENHTERQHVSLSQMLKEQSRLILHTNKSGDGNVQKQYFKQRKKFGFIQVPIPTKQSRKKGQPLAT